MKYTARYTSFVTMILKLHCNLSRMESIDNGVSLKLNKSMPIKNGVVKSWSSLLITETSFDSFNPTPLPLSHTLISYVTLEPKDTKIG